MYQAVLNVKALIPPEHRIQPEEHVFDIGEEVRQISRLLQALTADYTAQPSGSSVTFSSPRKSLTSSYSHSLNSSQSLPFNHMVKIEGLEDDLYPVAFNLFSGLLGQNQKRF